MKTINHSTSGFLVYEFKDFRFLIVECYGDTDTGRDNTSAITSSPPPYTWIVGKV